MVTPDKIAEAYSVYIASYGDKAWALSLESSLYLAGRISTLKPASAIDFGSGFTSWLLASCIDGPVYTVETEVYWRAVTSAFCSAMKVNTEQWHFMTLETIKDVKAELVVHDIKGDIRADTLDLAMDCLAIGGRFFADDCHRSDYVVKLLNAGTRHGIPSWDTVTECTDEYGRFPMVGIKEGR